MMNKENFLNSGLLERYVLGLASSDETNLVEKYASTFDDIQRLINTLRESIKDYAHSKGILPPQT